MSRERRAVLPEMPRRACERLRDGLVEILGPDLVGLWAYGAETQPDRPARLGDLDVHAVFARPPAPGVARAIAALQSRSAREFGVEWDAWYIAEHDARSVTPPRHVLQPHLVDGAWALHRAHWLAGAFVSLHGAEPPELVPPPSWPELLDALCRELAFIASLLGRGRAGTAEIAYCVCNACRVLYSVKHRDVVVSKRAASSWALGSAPAAWRQAIEAAVRVYDDAEVGGDDAVLRSSAAEIVTAVAERLSRETS
ncbi:MAG: DUF4111 domain-containing protein [Gemmatimonadota bacterium]